MLMKLRKKSPKAKKLILAGDESLLKELPKGQWIAGRAPTLWVKTRGICDKERIFVNWIAFLDNKH